MRSENNIYHLYKPLRNYLKQFSTMDSLGVIRAYLQYMQFGQGFPYDVQVDDSFLRAKSKPESGVYEWQLETLAKEIILNTETTTTNKTLREWRYFSGALNKLKDFENNISIQYSDIFKKQILIELYRISHRQFPWQTHPNLISLTRYYKIFSHPEIDSIIQKNTGLTTKELYVIGFAFTGVYIEFFSLNYPPELQILGITQEKIDKFLIDTMEAIITASFLNQAEKLPYVRLAIRKIDTLKIFLMILWETKSFDNKKYIALSLKLDEIGKMLGGWSGQIQKQNSLKK